MSFPRSRLIASGGQSIGASASISVLPMNIQGWCPLGLTGWISLQSKGLSRVQDLFSKSVTFVFAFPESHALWEPLTPTWSNLWDFQPYLVSDTGKEEMQLLLQCGSWRTWTRWTKMAKNEALGYWKDYYGHFFFFFFFLKEATSLVLNPFPLWCLLF